MGSEPRKEHGQEAEQVSPPGRKTAHRAIRWPDLPGDREKANKEDAVIIAEKRLICADGNIRVMTDQQSAHEKAKENVRNKILSLFKENDITIIEAEYIMRGIVDGAAVKAKLETTFSQLYGNI